MKALKLFNSLFLFLIILEVSAQDNYVKIINHLDYGNQVKVVATADNGWAVFSLDSLVLHKFNKCGNLEWTKKLELTSVSFIADFIPLMPSGFAVLARCFHNNGYATNLVKLDAAGNILWSKLYENNSFNQVPYTAMQTPAGDFMLFANSEHVLLNPSYNLLLKLDANGNILWGKYYDHGGIWGGAILTSDGGVLARTGWIFMKTDGNGNLQWSSRCSFTGYYYYPAVEVSDGYIFNGYQGGSNYISFGKMDKLGNNLWSGRKNIDLAGAPALLHSLANGNFITVFNKIISNDNYPTLVEFDKELNVLRSNSISISQFGTSLTVRDICPLADNTFIAAGKAAYNDPGILISNFIAKTDNLLRTGCDSSLVYNFTADTNQQIFENTNVINATFSVINLTAISNNLDLTLSYVCGSHTVPQLTIAGDSIICSNSAATLSAATSFNFDEYKWSTGETAATINVSVPGTFSLQGVANCGADTLYDSITVSASSLSLTPLLSDVIICSDTTIVLDVTTADATYKWQDGSTASTYSVTNRGNYYVDITLGSCTKRDSANVEVCEVLTMPNVFTPNNDNYNNIFIPIEMRGIADATLYIYNRWGQKLYTTNDILNKGWNGYHRERKSSNGVYYWVVEYSNYKNEHKTQHGTVSVIGID